MSLTKPCFINRPFAGEADFFRVRDLLIDTVPITPPGWNWEIRRWDGGRYHSVQTAITPDWSRRIHLWETDEGELVGVAHPEYCGDVHLELHPEHARLQDEMFAWAEAHLAVKNGDSPLRHLSTFVFDYDSDRQAVLSERGWRQTTSSGVLMRLHLNTGSHPPTAFPAPYQLRTVLPHPDDCQHVADLLNAAFHRTFHTGREYYNFATQSPSYRSDLELVAQAPNGELVAYVGVTLDEKNRMGIIEPVCTHPDHRRRGLARALLVEGKRRAQALGMKTLIVGTGDDPVANAFYESLDFTEIYRGNHWEKIF